MWSRFGAGGVFAVVPGGERNGDDVTWQTTATSGDQAAAISDSARGTASEVVEDTCGGIEAADSGEWFPEVGGGEDACATCRGVALEENVVGGAGAWCVLLFQLLDCVPGSKVVDDVVDEVVSVAEFWVGGGSKPSVHGNTTVVAPSVEEAFAGGGTNSGRAVGWEEHVATRAE